MEDPREGNGVELLPQLANTVLCLGERKALCEQMTVSWVVDH